LPMFGSVAADGSEPLLPLSLLGGAGNGAGGRRRENVEAVIDTGFDGDLTLQQATIRQLGYPYSGSAGGILADGNEVQFDYYEGRVLWHGFDHPVAVIGAEGQPLVGMGLLGGSRLTLDAEPGGEVLVEDLAEERA
jgi:predicted aspartyl protease